MQYNHTKKTLEDTLKHLTCRSSCSIASACCTGIVLQRMMRLNLGDALLLLLPPAAAAAACIGEAAREDPDPSVSSSSSGCLNATASNK
jgi:hypothetical protein